MSRGGGVCLLIKKIPGINVYQVELSDDYKELEIVAVDISDDSNILPFRLVVVYRPPCYTSHDNAQLFSALSHLADDCVRFCVVGDFNLPYFNWDLFVHPDNFLYNSAADFVRDNGLTQLVSDPTRDDSILDLILCSDVLCCDDVCCLAPLGKLAIVIIPQCHSRCLSH